MTIYGLVFAGTSVLPYMVERNSSTTQYSRHSRTESVIQSKTAAHSGHRQSLKSYADVVTDNTNSTLNSSTVFNRKAIARGRKSTKTRVNSSGRRSAAGS